MHRTSVSAIEMRVKEDGMPITVEGIAPMFFVYDVPRSVAFYRDVLGFEIVMTSKPFSEAKDDFGWALLRLNGVDLMLNNAYENNLRPSAFDPARIEAHADTVLYFACRDVDGAYQHLKQRGISVNPPKVAYYGMKQIYVTDPDGYSVCFQWPSENVS
jgi:glyoxylase I family protein